MSLLSGALRCPQLAPRPQQQAHSQQALARLPRLLRRQSAALTASVRHALPAQRAALAVYASSASLAASEALPSGTPQQQTQGDLGFRVGFHQRFTLGKLIGTGSYGQVQLVVDNQTGRRFAAKRLGKVRGRLSQSKTARKLWQEVDLLNRIQSCNNVARLEDVYEDDSSVYIVLELCLGGDLENLIEEHGPLSERQAALVLYECLKVVAACHSTGVVHGDIKPANFLLAQRMGPNPLPLIESGSVRSWLKAIDFGCSQETRGEQLSRRTGTPVYMAPEVFQREYGTAADMWSLGMMLYQFMTGRFPFWDSLQACRDKSLDEVMKSVIVDTISFDDFAFRNMSPAGLDLLKGLFERNPVQRMTAAEALRHPWFEQQRSTPPSPPQRSNVVPLDTKKSVVRRRSSNLQPAVHAAQQIQARVGRSYPVPQPTFAW